MRIAGLGHTRTSGYAPTMPTAPKLGTIASEIFAATPPRCGSGCAREPVPEEGIAPSRTYTHRNLEAIEGR